MEKTVYQIVQEWHELLVLGIVNETEFQEKKTELLGKDQTQQNIVAKETSANLNVNNQTKTIQESQSTFNYKQWFQNNKVAVVVVALIISSVSFWYYYNYIREGSFNNPILDTTTTTTQTPVQVSEDRTGYYIVSADNSNYVYFYRQPDISTKKKAHFESAERIYIQKIENDFGYVEFTNDKGQTTVGWLRMQDLKLSQ